MNYSFVFNRIKNLIINPKAEWVVIETEKQSRQEIIRTIALPLIIIVTLSSVVGDFIFTSRIYFSFLYVLAKAVGIFVTSYFGMILASQIINELTTSFNSKKDLDLTYKLVIYSLTIYYVVFSFVMFIPALHLLWVFEAYSVYLFWIGATTLVNTPDDNKAGFVVVSSLITLGVFAVLNLILKQILLGIFGVSIII